MMKRLTLGDLFPVLRDYYKIVVTDYHNTLFHGSNLIEFLNSPFIDSDVIKMEPVDGTIVIYID